MNCSVLASDVCMRASRSAEDQVLASINDCYIISGAELLLNINRRRVYSLAHFGN
mgnify:CR=1 FL=1